MQLSKWFSFWNMFISFLELFPATCFLCILHSQLTRRNTSVPKKLKKRQYMTFMMTTSNDDKRDICQFFYQDLFRIVNTVDIQNMRCRMFFHPLPPHPPFYFSCLWKTNMASSQKY